MCETYSLRATDRLVLAAIAIIVCLPAILIDHRVGLREAAFAQSLREMAEADTWLIPTIGGQPWVDALPLSQWFAHAAANIFGISNVLIAIRLAGVIPAVFATQWTASFAASCSGRRSGVLAGSVLLTTLGIAQNIWHGGNVIWLVAAGSGFMNLLACLESSARIPARSPFRPASPGQPGNDSLARVLGVFFLLGLTTMIAGTLAALVTILIPAAGHVFWRRQFRLRPGNPWLMGWLLTASVAAAWPIITLLNVADSALIWQQMALADGWQFHPFDQLVELIEISLPWLPLVILGQWSLRHDAFAGRYSRERLLACWSLSVPVAVFVLTPSRMDFTLAAAGAWSVSAAIGIERLTSRIFEELPVLATSHNRTILRKFITGCAAVLTLSSVWSDSGSNSTHVDREWLEEIANVAEEEQPLLVDMNLGDHAAVLLFQLGDLATPLPSDRVYEPVFQDRVIVTFPELQRSQWAFGFISPSSGASEEFSTKLPVIARTRANIESPLIRIATDSPASRY